MQLPDQFFDQLVEGILESEEYLLGLLQLGLETAASTTVLNATGTYLETDSDVVRFEKYSEILLDGLKEKYRG